MLVEIVDIILVCQITVKAALRTDNIQMSLLITMDLMEFTKDRVGDGMQWMQPELPIIFDALLAILVIIFGAWEVHLQMSSVQEYGIYGVLGTNDRHALRAVV